MRVRWRGLELPSRVVRDPHVSTDTYARFTAEPFERGFGTTVGNSLRRILLSSLEGAAVTHIKLKGADHEFSSLKGVMEDVTDIILNIKSLVVKLDAEDAKEMKVVARKAGPVTAAPSRLDSRMRRRLLPTVVPNPRSNGSAVNRPYMSVETCGSRTTRDGSSRPRQRIRIMVMISSLRPASRIAEGSRPHRWGPSVLPPRQNGAL